MARKAPGDRPYYSVIVKEQDIGKWQVAFGDYDKATACDELNDIRAYWRHNGIKAEGRIIATPDSQAALDAAVVALNTREART